MRLARRIRFQWRYFWNPPWDTGISPPELIDFIAKHPSGLALDLGCGTGTNAITLARHGWQVTGIDFAWRAIKIARRKSQQAGVNVDLRVGDVLRLDDLNGPFDLILDIGCYHSLPENAKVAYVKNLERMLASQGTFLMYGFFREPGETGPGMLEEDVERISARLELVKREDGTGHGMRPSVWLTYQRRRQGERADLSSGTAAGNQKT
jgi:SAM-dependent methyltransferase